MYFKEVVKMVIVCEAIVDEPGDRRNLCDYVKFLEGKPCVHGNKVSVEYVGDKATADKLIELFEHYARHSIFSVEEQRR